MDVDRAARVIRSSSPDVEIPSVPLPDFVLSSAAERGDKPALIDGPTGRTITYAQLGVLVRRCAAGLDRVGFRQGEVLAIYSPNLPEYAIAFHAAALLGGVTTTVNPLYTVDELAQQLRDSSARYLLTVGSLLEKATAAAARVDTIRKVFVFDDSPGATPFAALFDAGDSVPSVRIDPAADLVTLPYSSGTTGLAKGVMLTHRNLVAQMVTVNARADIAFPTEHDTLLAFLPFFHIYGIVVFLNHALHHGATIVSVPRFDLEQCLGLIQQHGVTFLHLVPPVVLALAKHPLVDRYDLSHARWALSAAAPLGAPAAEAFTQRLGTQLFQAYGMTEVSGATHVGSCAPGQVKPASGGRLLPNTECQVIDPATGAAVERGELGEIWVRGPLTMRGYLNRPDATAETIDPQGWLHTGDIGYVDVDGDVFVVDRVKELIKYKGLQVAPAELEALLLGHPAVADVAVIPSPDAEAGEVPLAFVVLKAPAAPDEIMAFVAERVAPHKRVRKVQLVESIPKSSAGKILRRVLVEQERQRSADADAPVGTGRLQL